MVVNSVLIVDDNPLNVKLIRTVLAGDEYEVRTASSAPEALNILTKFHPNLILTDIQMPGMNGLEFTRLLKSDSRTRDIIVVAATAYAIPGDEERIRGAGCSGYITKPIDTRTLPATLRRYLERSQAAKSAIQPGDYHDLLAECRTDFLVSGWEESTGLLRSLDKGFEHETAHRLSHRWAGLASILGFAEIARKARDIEAFVGYYGERQTKSSNIMSSGDYISRMRWNTLCILQTFSDALLGTRPTPALPSLVRHTLRDKKFAVVEFEDAEAARIASTLADARAASHVFAEVPSNSALKSFDGAVVNACRGLDVSAWLHNDVFGWKPILFVGSAETILRRDSRISEGHRCDFLLGPWDNDELILRAYRLFRSEFNRDLSVFPHLNDWHEFGTPEVIA